MKQKKQQMQFRPFNDPLEKRWKIWDLNGEMISVVADMAFYHKGVLSLYIKNDGQIGSFQKFRAAMQVAHGNFGFTHYWINDGVMTHVVEANFHSFRDDGNNVFIQKDHDIERLIAVFPHAAWWVDRNSRIYPDEDQVYMK